MVAEKKFQIGLDMTKLIAKNQSRRLVVAAL